MRWKVEIRAGEGSRVVTARFDQEGLNEPVVVLEPDDFTEAILLATWMRYDANLFSISVDRLEDGRIKKLTIHASDAR